MLCGGTPRGPPRSFPGASSTNSSLELSDLLAGDKQQNSPHISNTRLPRSAAASATTQPPHWIAESARIWRFLTLPGVRPERTRRGSCRPQIENKKFTRGKKTKNKQRTKKKGRIHFYESHLHF